MSEVERDTWNSSSSLKGYLVRQLRTLVFMLGVVFGPGRLIVRHDNLFL